MATQTMEPSAMECELGVELWNGCALSGNSPGQGHLTEGGMERISQPIANQRGTANSGAIVGTLLGISIGVVYAQAAAFAFLSWDDPWNVVSNELVRDGLTINGVLGAFGRGVMTHWQPLTTMSHMMDVSLYGMNPGGHHVTSLLLHASNTLLLFIVLYWMTGARWRSAFVAALFALHPMHVEPVAWISARRDVLSALFGLLSMAAYVSYARRGGVGRYVLVALFLVLALLAKSMLVTLPMVFLLLDYWPLGRVRINRQGDEVLLESGSVVAAYPQQSIKRIVLEKIPLLALSAGIALVAILMLAGARETKMVGKVPFPSRVAHAVVSYVVYIEKMICPTKLSPHYVHPYLPGGTPWATWQIVGAGLVLIILSALVIRMRSRHYLMVGWLWYLGTLLPVIGLIQLGKPGLADRYTYISYIGLFIIVAWRGAEILARPSAHQMLIRRISVVCIVMIIGACMVCSWRQVGYWRNSKVFLTHALEVSPTNAYLRNNYGVLLVHEGRGDEAAQQLRRALEIKPDLEQAHWNLSGILQASGRRDEAYYHYREAQKIEAALQVSQQ